MTLRGLVFDVDGTLAETEDLHRRAFNEAFIESELDWSWDRVLYKKLLDTTGGKERIGVYQRDYLGGSQVLDSEEITELHKIKTKRYVALIDRGALTLRPGIQSLLSEARRAGLFLAIATTTSYPNIDALSYCCWSKPAAEIFDVIASGDEVKNKKPAPDVYQLSLERLSFSADDCVAFEDSENGLLSAKAAGLRVIVTPGIYTEDQVFEGAVGIFPVIPGLKEISAILSEFFHSDKP